MKYSIAGYNLELIGENNCYIVEKMSGYESEFDNNDFLITYSVKDEIIFSPNEHDVVGAGRFSWNFDKEQGVTTAYTYSETHKLYLAIIKWNKEFNRADIYAIDSCPLGGPLIDVKLFGLVGQAFYYMLMMHHAYVVHASAISYKGAGLLFSAPSGTGKSTQTQMWMNEFGEDVTYINDDNPVLRVVEDKVYVYGTPWAGKNSINNNICTQLAAVVCLEQAATIEVEQLIGADAFFRIYNETNKPVLENMLEIMLSDLKILLDKIKVYLMKCNLTTDTVYVIKNLLKLK